MKWLLLVLALTCMVNCTLDYSPGLTMEFDIPGLRLEEYTVESVLKYVAARIRYIDDDIHDVNEYWQNPYQTWTWRTGDCEDFVILAMYLVYRDLGIEPVFVGGKVHNFFGMDLNRHAWIRINGIDWEPQKGMTCAEYESTNFYIYEAFVTIEYAEVIYRSANGHKRLTVN